MSNEELELGIVQPAEAGGKKGKDREYAIWEKYISPLVVFDYEATQTIARGETPDGVTPAPVQERFLYNADESDEKLKKYKLAIWQEACTLPQQQENFESALAQIEDGSHPLVQELYQSQQMESVEDDAENKAAQESLQRDIEHLRQRLESLLAGCKRRLEAMSSEEKWEQVGEAFYQAYAAFKQAGEAHIEEIRTGEVTLDIPEPGQRFKLEPLPDNIRELSRRAQRLALPPYTELYLKEKHPDIFSELYERK